MSYSYIVLGSGRQTTASAYDLGKFGEAGQITLADANLARTQSAAE
jgi:saccharopine dehydrogenase-like NADP-dependent oxidoreductase